MSEYQYYEFLAVDRPLTAEEISVLRAISTRAHITPVSFSNDYHWGDLKASPDKLMERFFDAHVYVANWMTAVFMARLPIEAIPEKTVAAMTVEDVLYFDAADSHWLITWRLDESENYNRFGVDDGRGWMARLAPVRDELLRGDIRSLYIGWLSAVTRKMVDDDELEPLPVEGLGDLTAAQQALAEFLEVDEDLLAGAGIGSPALPAQDAARKEMDDWLENLPRDEALSLLKQLLEGQGLKAERTLRNRFSAWRRSLRGDREEGRRRSVAELRKNAQAAKGKRLDQEKREQERLSAKRRKERKIYLAGMAKDFPKAWNAVQRQVARGSGLGYEEACRALVDICEAYSLYVSRDDFDRELKRFMAGHMRRRALVQRLVKAGIWQEE